MLLNRRRFLLAVLLATTCFAGCGPFDRPSAKVAEKDVIGTFEITWAPYSGVNLGKETITFKRNHRFEQVFVARGGKPQKSSGTWSLVPGGDASLTLDDVVQYVDGNHTSLAAKPSSTNVYTKVSKHGSSVWILVDDDLGLYYRKK